MSILEDITLPSLEIFSMYVQDFRRKIIIKRQSS